MMLGGLVAQAVSSGSTSPVARYLVVVVIISISPLPVRVASYQAYAIPYSLPSRWSTACAPQKYEGLNCRGSSKGPLWHDTLPGMEHARTEMAERRHMGAMIRVIRTDSWTSPMFQIAVSSGCENFRP
jgi:hypothetical protein